MNVIIRSLVLLTAIFACFEIAHGADPFTVANVPVDATGDTAIEAQTTAISQGQLAAADIIIKRLTLASERNARGVAPLTVETVAPLIRALEISNEKRSANRYFGDVTLAFNPSQMQAFLKEQGLTMISTQARPRLVLPMLEGADLWSENQWSKAWRTSGISHALTPVQAISRERGGANLISTMAAQNADLEALRAIGARYGVDQILIATAAPSSSGIYVQLKDVALDTGKAQNVGRVSGISFPEVVAKSVSKLEEDWKSASVSFAQNAVSVPASVLYNSHSDWLRIQSVINSSAQIQDARLDALAKDGALMTLSYGGDVDRLRNELAFKGVEVKEDPNQNLLILRISSRRAR